MNKHKITALLAGCLFLCGCQDSAQSHLYDKDYKSGRVSCMRLQLTPDDMSLKEALQNSFAFSDQCPYTLQVEHKSGIVCNSSYNAPQKALGKVPDSYLKLELRHGFSLLYSYYIDLDHKPDQADISKAMDRLKSDLGIPK